MGGSLKGDVYYEDLQPVVDLNCRAVYLIGEAAERIGEALVNADVDVVRCDNLERAVQEAFRRARPREVVLLAPACASFDQYREFEERGEHFRALVRGLT